MQLLRRTPLVGIAVAALVTGTGVAALASGSTGTNSTIPGTLPIWATAAYRVGTASGSQPVGFRVYLRNRDAAGAAAYARAVSTKGNALYGKFLTPAQFRTRFSPTDADAARVASWLRSQGFTIGVVPDNNKYVEAIGTVVEGGEGVQHVLRHVPLQGSDHAVQHHAPVGAVDAVRQVQGVIGLDESANLVHADASAPAGFRNAPPCSQYWGEKTLANTPTPDGTKLTPGPWSDNAAGTVTAYSVSAFAPCGYAGAQLQGAYGLTGPIGSGNDGTGVTVAVIDAYASRTIVSDVNKYSSRHGLPPITGHFRQVVAPGTYVRPQNPRQDPEGWSGEETLDIEAVHTMAPGADIVYVGAPNNYRDLDAIMNRVVDRHLADIVTNSYGYARRGAASGLHQAAGGHLHPGGGRGHQPVLLLG